MPSEHRRTWMKEYQRNRRREAERVAALKLLASGVPPSEIGRASTLRQRLGEMRRDRDALRARVEWDRGGIRVLRDRVATLQALLATQPAMHDAEVSENI